VKGYFSHGIVYFLIYSFFCLHWIKTMTVLRQAYKLHKSDFQIQGFGQVSGLLPDDIASDKPPKISLFVE